MPGDPIVGYVTRGKGLTIHRSDCYNIINERDRERLMDVSWGSGDESQRYAATAWHTLVRADGGLRIRLKRVDLLNCDAALPSIQLFL